MGLQKKKKEKKKKKKEESKEKTVWLIWLVGKHGVMSKPGPMLKFKRRLDLSDTCEVWLPLGVEAAGDIWKRHVLLGLMGFKSR